METSPKSLNYRFPAEWETHEATWLSWPHNKNSWPGKIDSIYPAYAKFIQQITKGERVCINVNNTAMETAARTILTQNKVDLSAVQFYRNPTNDAWCRDHGPSFVVNHNAEAKKAIINWNYNAWGNKYPYKLDNQIPALIAQKLNVPTFNPNIVMEGGSVDFNGAGTVITTTECLLNKNRNPHLSKEQIEGYLHEYYGLNEVLWLEKGIVGDDTDGHIDDITRFVNETTIVTVIEHSENDENYKLLKENAELLNKYSAKSKNGLNIVDLPMPSAVTYKNQRLPASYANFYICNSAVIVPTFRDKNDDKALDILQSCFEDKKVVGIDSTDIIWGLGSFHCLSQQEPKV